MLLLFCSNLHSCHNICKHLAGQPCSQLSKLVALTVCLQRSFNLVSSLLSASNLFLAMALVEVMASASVTDSTEPKGHSCSDGLSVKEEFLLPAVKASGDAPQDHNGGMKQKKKKGRGQNKSRPPPVKFDRSKRLCPVFTDVRQEAKDPPVCLFPNCQYLHDVNDYLDNKKGADLDKECPVFKALGVCSRGVTCRFGEGHLIRGSDGVVRNKVIHTERNKPEESNHLSKELQRLLWKKQADFSACDALVEKTFEERENAKEEAATPSPEKKRCKIEEDAKSDVRDEKRVIDWRNKLYLAPLTTVGNLPFRRICKSLGADVTCGEMAMALPLLQGHGPEWALVQRHCSEDLFGVQLCGGSPQQMARAAQLVEEHVDCDFVDINLGCPIDLVYKRGMGSGLMARKKPLEVMIKAMSKILTRPLTVKMRTGVYSDKRIAHDLIPLVRDWGAQMVTLHGRSREQRYTRLADWDYTEECALAASPMPLFGNGDILSYEDYDSARTRCPDAAGVMIARGALIKPWVFTEIKERRHWDISARERLDLIRDYAWFGLEHWGSDDKGVETTRRFLLEWLSFLHRYVPVGVLESPPQKINQRVPPRYRGRDDLETLLSSASCSDWVKISEMFLGKVPENFSFEPKHKANAYKGE